MVLVMDIMDALLVFYFSRSAQGSCNVRTIFDFQLLIESYSAYILRLGDNLWCSRFAPIKNRFPKKMGKKQLCGDENFQASRRFVTNLRSNV